MDPLKWHQKSGHKIITISGSPIEIVCEMAKKYDIDDYRGSIYVFNEEDNYTGEIIPMWDSESKEKAIHEASARYDIDLSLSYAYGDATGDFSMFKQVGNPVCINPTKELLKKILNDELKDRIKIIVERKDVIYSIDPYNISYQ